MTPLNYIRDVCFQSRPHQQSIGYWNFDHTEIHFQTMIELNFNHVGTNNAMTHDLVLSTKERRNERLK